MSKQSDYATKVYQDALALGIPEPQARLAAAQSSNETGYGSSAPGNAYFGIKAGRGWTGATQTLPTQEEINGDLTPTTSTFRAYSDPKASLADWWNTLQTNWPAAATATTFKDAVAGLNAGQPGGYATKSSYGNVISNIASNYLPSSSSALSAINSIVPQAAQPDAMAYTDNSTITPKAGLQSLAPTAANGIMRAPGTAVTHAPPYSDFSINNGDPINEQMSALLAPQSQPSSILPQLTSHSVQTVPINPMTGNPVASGSTANGNASVAQTLQEALDAKAASMRAGTQGSIPTVAQAGQVQMPSTVTPSIVPQLYQNIARAQQPNSAVAGSTPQATPQSIIPSANGTTTAKSQAQLQTDLPISAYGSSPTAPALNAISNATYAPPTTQYTTKAMTEANPAYEAYIKAQNADDIGSGPGSFSSLGSLNTPSIVPPKTITVNQRVPLAPASIPLSSLGTVNPASQILPNVASGFSSTPIGHIVQAVSGEPVSGGLLGLLFGGGTPSVLSQLTSAMQPTAAPAFPNSAGNGPVVGTKKTPDGYTTFNGDNGVPGNSGNWWASVTNQS